MAAARLKSQAPLRLPDAELDVLCALCHIGDATVRDLREQLAKRRPMSHGAMATLVKRLMSKGLISRQRGAAGKSYV